MKHIKIILLSMLLALTVLPAVAQEFEYEGIKYYVIDSEVRTCEVWYQGYSSLGDDIVIPPVVYYDGIAYNVVKIGDSAFSGFTTTLSINLPEGITTIGDRAFYACSSLTEIKLPEGITAIGNKAFYACSSMTEINLPEGITSIGDGAFNDCSSLTEIVLPEGITSIGDQTFYGCSGLTSIKLPEGITSIGDGAFCVCSSLTEMDLPKGVTSIGQGAFAGCSSLTSIKLPEEITIIGNQTFSGCSSLTEIVLPEGITSIGDQTFFECSGLTEIVLPKGITSIGGSAFNDCSSLTEIKLPEGITTIGDRAFNDCRSLTEMDLPKGVTSIGDHTFGGCNSLISIKLPEEITIIGDGAFAGCNSLTEIKLPEGITTIGDEAFIFCSSLTEMDLPNGVTSIGDQTFYGCSSLTSIKLPEGITTIRDRTFYDCISLPQIKLPEGITTIGNEAFFNCSSLTEIKLPEEITTIWYSAFYDCKSLASITIPNSVQSIYEYAFLECDALVSIHYAATQPISAPVYVFRESTYANATLTMPNATLADIQATVPWNMFAHIVAKDGTLGSSLNAGDDFEYEGIIYTVIDPEAKTCKTKDGHWGDDGVDMVSGNTYEGDLAIPATVTDGINEYTVVSIGSFSFSDNHEITSVTLPEGVATVGYAAFSGCLGITTLNLPQELTTIDLFAFQSCSGLTSVTLPNSLQSIGAGAFRDCKGLASIDFSDNLTIIGEGAFWYCSGLTSLTLPTSLTTIEGNAFFGCSGLTNIILPNGLISLGVNAFHGCTSITSISLPESIITIDQNAFGACDALINVSYEAILPIEAPADIFYGNVYENGTLNMPNASLTDIQATVPWNLFGRIVAADGEIGGSLNAGDNFEYQGIIYTVIDAEARTCKTKDGGWEGENHLPGNSYSGDLVIPANVSDGVNEYTVTELGEWGFLGNRDLTSVNLPETLRAMGTGVFYGCSSLTSIEIPDSVTIIPGSAFDSCTSLATIKFPEKLTVISGLAFANCEALASLDFPESLTTIEGFQAFANCTALTSVVFPESLTYIGEDAFLQCYNLKSVTLSESLTYLGKNAFYVCGLTSIKLPASLTTIESGAFKGSTLLTEVTYDAATPIVTDSDVFETDVYKNATLNMPNAALADIQATVPWNMFSRIVASDGDYGFSLKAGDDFEYEGIIYTIIDSEAKTCKTKDGTDTTPGNTYEGNLVIPATVTDGIDDYSVIAIGDYGFIDNAGIESVTLPEGLTTIGASSFLGCSNLTTVSLPEHMTSIGAMAFRDCGALVSIALPEGLTSLEFGVFYTCSSLTTIAIPEGLTTISDEAFAYCSSLTTLSLPATLQSIIGESAFYSCDAISTIYYGASKPIEASASLFEEPVYANATLEMPNAALADIQATVPWNLFGRIVASDGTVTPGLNAGEEFEYQGIIYTVTDAEAKTCKTKDGVAGKPGNVYAGDLVIPQTASDGNNEYTVAGIGEYGFEGSAYLTSVTLPASIEAVGADAFAECPRLTSVVWMAESRMPHGVTEAIANPNLLVYVAGEQYAPAGMSDNVVVMHTESGTAECRRLVLEPGYPFGAVRAFDALYSTMTKEFTQTTPIGGCAGWETIVLPFDATSVAVDDARGELTPFALVTDITTQYPYWLYEAASGSNWKEALGIKAGVPYVISMPNNADYASRYRISGPVTFSNPGRTTITPETTAPYALTWASGQQFRSLWLPLDADEVAGAMGLNVNMDNLTDDEGHLLAPGSAFHADVEPRPLEAYVTRMGSRRALPVMGGQAHLALLEADGGLIVTVEKGTIYVSSPSDRRIEVFRVDGVCFGSFEVKGGELLKIEGLAKGMYIVAGNKVIIK